MTPKRIGLMGCGTVADYGHIPAIQETSGLLLSAVYDPNPLTVKQMQDKYHISQGFTDSKAFFEAGLDAVVITSPAPFHKENVLGCAKHKLPALCEKPLAMNQTEVAEMITAMDASKVSLHSAFCYRFSPCALKIRELALSKAIGEVRSLRLVYNWDLHGKYMIDASGHKVIQKRREERMLEGGPLVDCGTHQIDLAMFWLQSEVTYFSAYGAWVDNYEAPDHMWLHMNHANGAQSTVEVSYSYHHTAKQTRHEFVYELIGSDGVIRYDREEQSFVMNNAEGSQVFDFYPDKNFEGMYTEWSQFLHTGQSQLLTTAKEAMRVTEIARVSTDEVIKNRLI
jgi:predicted dehydrogenase